MSVRALVGLGVFNVFLLIVGTVVLSALRGWRSWLETVRSFGLAYLLGVGLVGVALSIELPLGVPFSLTTVVVTGVVLALSAVALRGRLAGWHREPPPRRAPGLWPVSAAFGLLVVIYLEALFRASRLSALSAWDAWAFWVPKGMVIYFFGGLDEQFFREIVNPTYPPLVPALDAAAFHFMGSADVITLHVQFWFYACGFVAAVAGVLAPRVSPLLLWPSLLLVLVAPRIVGRTLDAQADFVLDYFFAIAVLLVALWLVDREPWLLATASVFMASALVTKRDGLMLVASLVIAALVASLRDWRFTGPRLVGAVAFGIAATIPWRIWFSSRDLPGEAPAAGLFAAFENLERGWPAFESAITALFDYELWLVAVPLVAAAVFLAYLAGARTLPTYALTLYVLVTAGITLALWSFTELEFPFAQDEGVNPIVRLSGALVITSAALLPLLLDAAWRGSDRAAPEEAQ